MSDDDPERHRLESECLESLLAWHQERNPGLRTAAWMRMMVAVDELIKWREGHGSEGKV